MQPRITDISSPSNPVLKALKALSDKRGRREAGQIILLAVARGAGE